MSAVVIQVIHKPNGWCDVEVDGKKVGTAEDPEQAVIADLIQAVLDAMDVENFKVIEVQQK